ASPASGFARRVRRRSGRSVRLRPVLGSLLPGSHPTTSTTTHPSPTASLTVQTRQNQGWPSCGSSQSRSRASENHTVAINITGPCDDQAVLHHEMGLTHIGHCHASLGFKAAMRIYPEAMTFRLGRKAHLWTTRQLMADRAANTDDARWRSAPSLRL